MKKQEMIILILVILAAALTVCFFLDGEKNYEKRYFNPDKVNTLNIIIDENIWEYLTTNPLLEEYVPCSIELNGDTYNNIGIRTSGNRGSLDSIAFLGFFGKMERYQFKFKADEYIPRCSFRGLDKFVIRNMAQDASYSREYLIYELSNILGITVPACSYVAVYVNGEYFGLYLMLECIDKSFVHRNYGNKNVHIYRPDYLEYKGDDPSNYSNLWQSLVYGIETEENKAHIINTIKQMNNSANVEKYVDIDAIISYFALMSATVNADSYINGNNYFLAEVDGKLTFIPWDNDQGLGSNIPNLLPNIAMFKSIEQTINFPIDTPLVNKDKIGNVSFMNFPLLQLVLSTENYRSKYHRIVKEITADFLGDYLSKRVDEIDAMIGEYVKADPTKFVTYNEYKEALTDLKKFGYRRAESILGQLNGITPSTWEGQIERPDLLIPWM